MLNFSKSKKKFEIGFNHDCVNSWKWNQQQIQFFYSLDWTLSKSVWYCSSEPYRYIKSKLLVSRSLHKGFLQIHNTFTQSTFNGALHL